MEPFFTVIIVCLNPGDKLAQTLQSVEKQTFYNFEVIIKDGLSGDGSLSCAYALQRKWEEEAGKGKDGRDGRRLAVISRKDNGIYDAMNQAAEEAKGSYVYYLNCGDRFASQTVLAEMADFISGIQEGKRDKASAWRGIFYGDIFERLTGQRVASNSHMDAFACYRNVPCHQACFYSRELLLEHPFDTGYKVRADYEQFLWCFFRNIGEDGGQNGTDFIYKEMIIADYEGGGFSESRENRKLSAKEHREITGKYMSFGQLLKFRLIMLLTLSALRTKLAENEKTSGAYNKVKEMIYRRK